MPAAETHNHADHHMAYPQHQTKNGPPRPGPPHAPPHHASHPSGPYGPGGPPGPPGSQVGYGHHGPPGQHGLSSQHGAGQRSQVQNGPPLQNGPQGQLGPHIGPGSQQRSQGSSQHGPPGPHGHPGPHGMPVQRGPPVSHGSYIPPAPPPMHKNPGPHGQFISHIPHSNSMTNQRGHPDIPSNEIRQPPAYPEPPRYPGPYNVHEEVEKHLSQPLPHSGLQGQSMKQYPGPVGPGGGGGGGGGGSGGGSGSGGGGGGNSGGVNGGVGNNGSGGTVSNSDGGRLEDELNSLNRGELVGRTLRAEREMRELQHQYHQSTGELRHLRDNQQRLTDDNQELRDLCCFLDDDRQKGRKLAREWQRFGRYTASVMRQEVTAYQNKLRELDTKQQELIKDNLELKELCLYLDEERNNAACSHCGHPLITRDDGDGSSSSTNADEPLGPPQPPTQNHQAPAPLPSEIPLTRSSSRERLLEDTLSRQRSPMNEQVLSYIRSLESRVMVLETEKQQLTEELYKMDRTHPEGEGTETLEPLGLSHNAKEKSDRLPGTRPPQPPPYSLSHHLRAVGLGITNRTPLGPGSVESDDEILEGPPPPLVSRPTAVAAAMRVLEVQEQLENTSHPPIGPPPSQGPPPAPQLGSSGGHLTPQDAALADGEKALLRQMCSVVWKKLEEVPNQPR